MPALHWLELDDAVLGMPFFVMERLDGVVPVQWRGKDPAIFPDDAARREIGLEFVRRPDPRPRDRPADRRPRVPRRARLRRRRGAGADRATGRRTTPTRCSSSSRSCATRSAGCARTSRRRGASASATATTGSGTSCSARRARIVGVFDWELAHLSDPVEDIAYAGLPLFRGRKPAALAAPRARRVLRALRGADRPSGRGRVVPLLDRARAREDDRLLHARRPRLRGGADPRPPARRDGPPGAAHAAAPRGRRSSSNADAVRARRVARDRLRALGERPAARARDGPRRRRRRVGAGAAVLRRVPHALLRQRRRRLDP